MPGWPPDVPGWPDDVPPAAPSPPAHRAVADGVFAADPPALSAAGAFDGPGGRRVSLFDPGRRGVRALLIVAVAVVVLAAYLAWRGRPQVEVVPPPLATGAVSGSSASAEPERIGAPAASAGAAIVVAVGGKVRKPGLVELPPGARVADALTAAGGAEPGVDVAPLNLARKVVDGELIMVGVTPPPGAAPTAPAGATGAGAPPGLVNLNTATLTDLDGLPGVGPILAQRILDARESRGGFTAVTDLQQVDGIGTARWEQLKDLVTI
ncbi:ComEA family DNA-binding protein [Symbioplanes lichenis]|uniref:helix-hairpin-helix domain-containing protein n=1 Tax=Symbioplanes lichenis TaxID=1629072 RepID=UPI002739D284|nr:ComEA family DNA-binding protein [Actinoplanes lichenis]